MTAQTVARSAATSPSRFPWLALFIMGVLILAVAAALATGNMLLQQAMTKLQLGGSTSTQAGQTVMEGHSGTQKVSITVQRSATGGCLFRIDLWIRADSQNEWKMFKSGHPSESTTPCSLDFLRAMIEADSGGLVDTGWWIAKQLLFGELITFFATQ